MSNFPTLADAKAPFFVIGSPRSGTTLLRLVLTSHTALVVPPECGFVIWLYPSFGTWGSKEFSDPKKLSSFASAVSESRKFETWGISTDAIQTAITRRQPRTFSEACDSIYHCFCSKSGKASATWGDKNNFYLSHIRKLADIFPNARFLHIVRDGRDIACSYQELMAMESNSPYRPVLPVAIHDIAKKWVDDIRAIRRQLADLDDHRVLELRYEDLVAEPRATVGEVCDWLGCSFELSMLEFHVRNKANELEPESTMDWKKRTLEPISTSSVGRHKLQLDGSDSQEFASIALKELRQYHYID